MMERIKFFALALCLLTALSSVADNKFKHESCYDYQRGCEAYNATNFEEAKTYFGSEVNNHEDNYLAWGYLSLIHAQVDKEPGKALTAINYAIKYADKKEKSKVVAYYGLQGQLYEQLGDSTAALKSYCEALKIDSKSEDVLYHRGILYYNQGKYTQSIADFQQLMQGNSQDKNILLWYGANQMRLAQYNEAIGTFNKMIAQDANNSNAYYSLGKVSACQKKYQDAINQFVISIQKDTAGENSAVIDDVILLSKDAYDVVVNTVKAQQTKDPTNDAWPVLLGYVYTNNGKKREAANSFAKAYQLDEEPLFASYAVSMYLQVFDVKKAFHYADEYKKLKGNDSKTLNLYWALYFRTTQLDSALSYCNQWVSNFPDDALAYALRSSVERYQKNFEKAVEDLDMYFALEPEDNDYKFVYGRALNGLGRTDEAKAVWQKVVDLDPEGKDVTTIYSHLALGNYDKVMVLCDTLLKNSPTDEYYANAAEFYSFMGKPEQAIAYLRTAFEKGYRQFGEIEQVTYYDSVRNLPEFKALVNQYKAILEKENAEPVE